MFDVSEIIRDADLAQSYTVKRVKGMFVDGVWTESEPFYIEIFGPVLVSSPRSLMQVPEGDRVSGSMDFYSVEPLYITRSATRCDGGFISDRIVWRRDEYKLISVLPWADFGYYMATGVRVVGV